MKNWVPSRGWDSFWKTLVFFIVVHVLLLVFGSFLGDRISAWGLNMFWPHWETGVSGWLIPLIVFLVVYWIIYQFCSKSEES